jgi:uncharacterized membrane protein (DUF373 family)
MKDQVTKFLQYYLVGLLLLAFVASNLFILPTFLTLDWSNIQSFVEVVRLILLWVITLELIRLILEYKSEIVIELLIFVVARNVLLLEHDFFSLFVGVACIIFLLALRFWILEKRQVLSQNEFHLEQ